ncbi:hypothetical protein PV728_01565 [Streptomyces europaeiscabiei]|uniref:hypothetical protein n=1 Tax=Streptomyces europaeiscabiei TaxID=146819 RepID=UPI0029AC28BF|nr:hypothetical protein [Streptomyces europaeiscabiei]MDX3629016.1 hypothetical protein [Streptomyces europaeiscabiei]MDX3647366.1 hypothetical protein [Streptomyces europaeiscabiei]
MNASSHPHPFGFHASGPKLAAPMPLREVPALQAAVNPDLPATPLVFQGPEPVLPMCASCGNRRGPLAPHGQQRYRSGAQVLVCRGGCEITPVQAATGVITAAMTNGAGTPQEWAQAEEDAGLLFDPKRAKDIETAAHAQGRDQARAEMRAQLEAGAEAVEALEWLHGRLLATAPVQEGNRAVRRLCGGRRPDDWLSVSEVLRAVDGNAPAPAPLTITWNGHVSGSPEDQPGESTLVGCTAALGGSVVLALDDDQRTALAEQLLATAHPDGACATPGCGLSADDLDTADPTVWGWICVDVAGSDGGPRWWCSSFCAIAAMTAAAAQLATAAQLAATDPAQQAPYLPAPMVIEDGVRHCLRCGCTEARACIGGCHWVPNAQLIDLCSACASSEDLAFAAFRPQGGQGATQ